MASYKLLLADDSLTIQKVVELVLADENFEIKAVGDGEQALEAIGSFVPDIVLADIDMPKLNGYQLCEKIKNSTSTVHIPVVLLAGAFEPFDEEASKAAGADDSIIKPFESQELISKVKALLVGVEPSGAGAGSLSDGVQEMQPAAPEEPGFEEEIRLEAEEKDVFQGVGGEELAKGFDEELSEAMVVETPAVSGIGGLIDTLELPGKEEIEEIVRKSVESRVSDMFGGDSIPALVAAVKEAASANLAQNAPKIIEDAARQLAADIMQTLHAEISSAIRKIVPEVAETIIKKEIEKITARS